MKYDDDAWHLGDDFPENLNERAAVTHVGIFLAWCLENELTDPKSFTEADREVMSQRRQAPSYFIHQRCDRKLLDAHLSEEGNAFAHEYYSSTDEDPHYIRDYERAVRRLRLETMYHAPDTWESYDRVRPYLDKALASWRKRQARLH
ncbi:DUF7832 domain-containing protein [Galactobacter caseinivorans]|uniref:DUF7832 domain-containing protein n=1 Tax=Galactobacter caseinivorans TaxID=2676123 RepID=A0A496PKU9_9MICC|nr:hypothetical protein [Galactobacter caseinivorans]RKW71142.1 hypothetical protein DWQ67_04970 [Galactobacter caseinivorans]